jgi:putrescine transport system permease protein
MCYVSVVVSSRLVTFDRSLEEAALDLGASPWESFRLVTLPIIAPAVISGWLLAFTLSLDDLVIASFTAGPSATTLPIKIFSAVRLGVSPEINALSTIMILIVTVGVISASLVSKQNAVRAQKDARAAERTA